MWKAPSLNQLSKGIRSSFKAAVAGSDPWIWPNTFYVVTKVFALLLRGLYQRQEKIHRQARIVTADGEALAEHAADVGLSRNPATYARGNCTVVTVAGSEIPAGTRVLRTDGTVFTTVNSVIAAGASTTVAVKALEAGKAANTLSGATLSLETPITDVGAFTVDASGLSGGVEIETDASLRSRLLNRSRNPPHGGSPPEFVGWAREFPGVTRVFVKRATPSAGSVTILFMMDDTYATGIPVANDVAALKEHLEDVAPSMANIVVQAPTPKPINVTISFFEDVPAVRDAITAELKAMFRRRAQPGTAATPFVFSKSWIDEAVSIAAGEISHTLSAPAGDTSCGDGELAVLGTLTFV